MKNIKLNQNIQFDSFNNVYMLQRPKRLVLEIAQNHYKEFQDKFSYLKVNKINFGRYFFFLSALNRLGLHYMGYNILTEVFNLSKKTLNSYNKELTKHRLLSIEKIHVNNNQWEMNSYYTGCLLLEKKDKKSIKLEYVLNEKLIKLFNHYFCISNLYNKNLSHILTPSINFNGNFFGLTSSQITTYNQNKELSYINDLYFHIMMNRYTKLETKYEFWSPNFKLLPTFVKEEGRWYHMFHSFSKDEREYYLKLDGYNIKEYWDLHNAMFVYLYLQAWKILNNTWYNTELKQYKKVVLSGHFYEDIMDYCNEHNYIITDRNLMKEECQKYLSYETEDKLNSHREDALQYLIDSYFMTNFPNIRNIIVKYPLRTETKEIECTLKKTGKKYKRKITKCIKCIHRDLIKYEMEIIVFGICKYLEEHYHVKPITVHDAIYFNTRDIEIIKDVDIDKILADEIENIIWDQIFKSN